MKKYLIKFLLLWLVIGTAVMEHDPPAATTLIDKKVPEAVDWRELGAVLPVVDQGGCGACWAFSTIDTIASLHYITTLTKDLEFLSAQQLIDCVFHCCGCKHGYVHYAYEFVMKNGGITTEENYPYTMKEGSCITHQYYPMVTIDGYRTVPRDDEDALLQAVANQPVSVKVDAHGENFRHYTGGVFSGPCGTDLNHQVTIVGYGTKDEIDYWIIKNSWGTNWGENGYMRLERGKGICGIAKHAIYPIKN